MTGNGWFNGPAIETMGLRKVYGDLVAVDGLNLQIQPGEIFGFLGPNGAGKTTSLKMMVGLLRPTAGVARILGYDVQQQAAAAKSLLGYVPDQPLLYDKLTGREFLRFIARLYQVEDRLAARRSEELLRLFGLSDQNDDLIESYSHGMRQKTALAGALIHDPQVLFLDEPTVGLDPRSARLIKDLLRELSGRGVAVCFSTHILEIAERMCDRVGIIDHGRLIAVGTMAELRHQSANQGSLEDIFLSLTGGAEYAEFARGLA